MGTIDELAAASEAYGPHADLPARPARKVAVVACMDARIDVFALLGLAPGDAHVIRNAGGVLTDDVRRSLLISQRLLGTEEIMLVHHTGCGMTSFRDEELKDAVEAETGVRPPFPLGAFADVDADVREAVQALRRDPLLPRPSVRGFVYDLETGALREVLP